MLRACAVMLVFGIALHAEEMANTKYIDSDPATKEQIFNGTALNTDLKDREFKIHKRAACGERGSNCDHGIKCCDALTCRCNLWGSNCRCQRMGLV